METHIFFYILIVLNSFIIIITLYLSFLFIKSKEFHTISCYNMIIFSLILCLDNVCRIIPFGDDNEKDYNIMEYIQAYLLVWFDKLILATLSMQALIYFLGVTKTNFYYAHEKAIFIITFIISLIITLSLSGIYIFFFGIRKSKSGIYFYCKDSEIKKIIDTIFNSIYFLINLFCLVYTLCYSCNKKKEATVGDKQDFDYKHYFIRTLIMFLLNNCIFLLSFFIIYYVDLMFHYDLIWLIDIIYLTSCFALALFNSVNRIVCNETQKIFCKKKIDNKKYCKLKTLKTSEDEGDKEDDDN